MAKVTSKLQVTVPKAIAQAYGIRPGDEIEFEAAGEVIRVVPPSAAAARKKRRLSLAERLRLFDEAEAQIRAAQRDLEVSGEPAAGRGWTRDELYDRGKPR